MRGLIVWNDGMLTRWLGMQRSVGASAQHCAQHEKSVASPKRTWVTPPACIVLISGALNGESATRRSRRSRRGLSRWPSAGGRSEAPWTVGTYAIET